MPITTRNHITTRTQAHVGLLVFFWHNDMEQERDIESIQCDPESKAWHGTLGYGVDEQFFICGDLNDQGEPVMTGLRIAALNTHTSDITVILTYISYLTPEEIEFFTKECGHPEEDLGQLGRAILDVKLTCEKNKNTEVPITREQAEQILGYEEFLSGVARAAFHADSYRVSPKGKGVSFNLHHWWK